MCQSFPPPKVSGTDLVDENSLPEFSTSLITCESHLIEEPSDLPLFRQG